MTLYSLYLLCVYFFFDFVNEVQYLLSIELIAFFPLQLFSSHFGFSCGPLATRLSVRKLKFASPNPYHFSHMIYTKFWNQRPENPQINLNNLK